jgi:hypothetical protein
MESRVRVELCRGYGTIPARTCDVGIGGLCIETATSIALSEISGVDLRIDECRGPLRVRGRWHRFAQLEQAWQTGLQCIDPSQDQIHVLSRLVRESSGELVRFLRSESTLGEALTFDELCDVASCTRVRHARAGTSIWRGGRLREVPAARDSLFILRSGTVLIEPEVDRGRRVCLDQIREGSLFGGLGLLTDLSVPLTALAGADCVLLEVDGGSFTYLERSRPRTAERLRELIVDRLSEQLAEVVRHVMSA